MGEPGIPVIDVTTAIDGTAVGAVAAQVDRACRDVGFFQITGHGVDRALLDAVYDTAPDVWALPPTAKQRLRSPSDHPFYGWSTMDDPRGVALMEKWEISRFDSADEARAHGAPEAMLGHFGVNLWPGLSGFDDAVRALFTTTRALGDRIMGVFAVALGLPEDHFAGYYQADSSYFAVNSYPGAGRADPGEVALYEHTDSGTLTLLHQRGNYEGLEVQMRSGVRTRVPVVADAFVVNIGDLMARWTNDHWVATPHRVVVGRPGEQRTSLATFHTPSVDAIVEPLAPCVGPEGTSYEPVNVHDWEPVFLAKSYR